MFRWQGPFVARTIETLGVRLPAEKYVFSHLEEDTMSETSAKLSDMCKQGVSKIGPTEKTFEQIKMTLIRFFETTAPKTSRKEKNDS